MGSVPDMTTTAANRPTPEEAGPGGSAVPTKWPEKGPMAGYHSRGGKIAGIIFTAIWLVYLIGPVVDLFTNHYDAVHRYSGLAIMVAFCAVYVTLVPNWPSAPRHTLPGLGVLAVLAALACILFG